MSNFEEVKLVLCEMLEELDDRLAKITDDVRHTDDLRKKIFQSKRHKMKIMRFRIF